MVTSHPMPPPEFHVALKKLQNGEPLTRDEAQLIHQRIDELISLGKRRTPTEQLHALGFDGEIVISGTADEVIAYLDATEPCVSST